MAQEHIPVTADGGDTMCSLTRQQQHGGRGVPGHGYTVPGQGTCLPGYLVLDSVTPRPGLGTSSRLGYTSSRLGTSSRLDSVSSRPVSEALPPV